MFNRSLIFLSAWEFARGRASREDGSARSHFAGALRQSWADAKRRAARHALTAGKAPMVEGRRSAAWTLSAGLNAAAIRSFRRQTLGCRTVQGHWLPAGM